MNSFFMYSKQRVSYGKTAVILSLLVMLFFSCNKSTGDTSHNDGGTTSDIVFTPDIPVDVDPAVQEKLKKSGDINGLNAVFNEYSWKALIAIMWPTGKDGKPMPKFTDEGAAAWQGWKEAFQVYRKDGLKPSPWGGPMDASGHDLTAEMLADNESRLVLSTATPAHKNHLKVADETDQAFAGKLFDQNGNVVVYEVLLNKAEYDYIVDNQLYNINGQIVFSKSNPLADFPAGNYNAKQVGAVEIKFAWKILTPSDIKERYYNGIGYLLDSLGKPTIKKELGLIGMHISQKTPTGKQWVWSTFEHIDNLEENTAMVDGKNVKIHPTLYDPECEICPVNVDVSNGTTYAYEQTPHGNIWNVLNSKNQSQGKYYANSSVMKTQAKRMIDIPSRVQHVNAKMQAYFKSVKSVWQYYQLIDTQYPLDQDAAPGPHEQGDYVLPISVVNKPGGKPNIALLTNITMETFFQIGNQGAGNLIEGNVKSDINIFGTESCMGCHSSAGLYDGYTVVNKKLVFNSGGQLSGDFSWLLGKANWDKNIPRPTK